MTKLVCLGVLLQVAACGEKVTPPVPATQTARTVAQGEVVGLVVKNGAHVWLGDA